MNRYNHILLLIFLLPSLATAEIQLNETEAQRIGEKIWMNEGAGKREYLTVWNKGEDFPSFGIGHFIWYPAGVESPFIESFPALRDYLQQQITLPHWLQISDDSPWQSREQFYHKFDGKQMQELRQILENNIPLQVAFIIQRMEDALPKMLTALPESTQRNELEKIFYRVAAEKNGSYALIDYINFKGEGTAKSERYQGQGWGLLQVLQAMDIKAEDIMHEFSRSADTTLTRRVNNAPRDESHWLPGWRKRLKTYHND